MDETFKWFCGTNSSYTDDSLAWYSDVRNNTCLVDGLVTIPHAAYLLLSSLILLVLGCFTSYRKVHTKYLLVYPGHSLRWLVSVLLLVIILASIGEGIMTDETYQAWQQPTQPHLYIHGIAAFVAVGISLVYYHHMELWQLPVMSVLLLVYWLFSLSAEALRLASLEYQRHIDVQILIFDLTLIKLAVYLVLIAVEANVLRIKLCHRDEELPNDLKKPEMKCMQYHVSLFSSLSYWWVNWLLILGYKKPLELSDLGVVPERHEARFLHKKFQKAYMKEMAEANRAGKQASLFKVYMKVYGQRMLLAGLLKIFGELCAFIGPLIVGELTVYVTTINFPSTRQQVDPAHLVTVEEFFTNGFVLVAVMFLAALINAICLQTHYYISIVEGMNVGAAIQTMVYEKSLRMSTVAITSGKMNVGQITNHMSVDQDAVQFLFQNICLLCAAPLQLAVNLTLLYVTMGFSALIGASVFLVIMPMQFKVASFMSEGQKKLMGFSDKRLEKTNELLQGIKLLKLYAWEGLYCKAIEAVRAKELNFLYKINVGYVITLFFTFSSPVFVTILSYGTYTALTGKLLTPEVTFSALSLFNMLFLPFIMLPTCLLYVINGVVSTKRLQRFLAAPEIESNKDAGLKPSVEVWQPGTTAHDVTDQNSELWSSTSGSFELERRSFTEKTPLIRSGGRSRKRNTSGSAEHSLMGQNRHPPGILKHGTAIKISNGNFLWDSAFDEPVLSDINLRIPEGKLTIVIGQVGSGKSSLLSAILGEMTTVSGTVQIRDRNQVALAAQKPWLMNCSLRQNVTFSEPFDAQRYKRVLKACALKPDIEILPAGDQTEIGEKGINLSGGQKQRVSVARAMYSRRDIVILDDPLSALDVHVGSHLFTKGIMKLLIRQERTVVLVTHQLQYLHRADLIIRMEGGRISAQGTLQDIMAAYPDVYNDYEQAIRQATDSEAEFASSGQESESVMEERMHLRKQVKATKYQDREETADASGALMEKEEMERGSMSIAVYLYFARNFGLRVFLLAVALAAMYAGLNIWANFQLSAWADSGIGNISDPGQQINEYFPGFVALEMSYLVSRVVSYAIVVWGILRAAKRLHQKMLRNIVRVPLRFFDTVPIGRVLNRFSNDIELIDVRMAHSVLVTIASSLNMTSAVIVNTIVMPIFLAFFTPFAIGYLFLQRYFLASSRELQRLNSTSKSPVLAYFSETLAGLTTIRAYKASDRFYKALLERINTNLAAFLYLQTVIRWVCARLDFLGATTVLLGGLASLVGALTLGLTPSLVGLSVSYTLQVSQFLNYFTRMSAEVEMQMNAVERVKHYTWVSMESYEGKDPPPDWPQNGSIQMEGVSVRYAQDTDAVLRDITVDFKAGEKVGICGRTGAGKSSLTLALLRVIDIFQGRILIDGIDIMTVPLTTLRSKLSIIPQDPVLFTGTIRKNLNPAGSFDISDEDVWHALEIAQLKDVVSSLDGGLEFMVTEGGENFSVGQRQLFCLARAFLRKSRILVMDEATASMDLETDRILQTVVTTAFAERTVLTIAHRITTILNSDSILVLDEGRLAEYGTPDELLEKEDGIFASFVRDKDA